jgi:hypothetical protein
VTMNGPTFEALHRYRDLLEQGCTPSEAQEHVESEHGCRIPEHWARLVEQHRPLPRETF